MYIFFIINMFCIFSYEYISYWFNGNYLMFIKNLANRLAQENILYVKVFQAISLNNSLIDSAINNELLRYTDSAPYTYSDIDWLTLRDIKKEFNLNMKANEPFPINSGMISLVYKMYKNDTDEPVIIKIKRHNIERKLEDAIEKLMFLIKLLSFVPRFNTLNIPAIVNKNLLLLKQQLNFEEEIQNTNEMKTICSKLKYIKIPQVYPEVTQKFPNVIMMEYIQGVPIYEVDETDYETYAKLVLKYGFASLLLSGVTHGDLHGGNILFIKNDDKPMFQIGLIDFGIVFRIDNIIKNKFLELTIDLYTRPAEEITAELLNLIIEPKEVWINIPKKHTDSIIALGADIIRQTIHSSSGATQIKLFEFVTRFNNYLKCNDLKMYGLEVDDNFVKLQLALAMSHGVSLCLCKNKYMDVANDVLNSMFHTDLLNE